MSNLFFNLSLFLLIAISQAYAQLSPGDLHKAHAHLEGIENCTQCHEKGEQLQPSKCLGCHTILKEKINNNQGLHSNKKFTQCENCHVEHQGRNFDLVYWENGLNGFNHSLTGYKLEGSHRKLKCEKCHTAKNIPNPKIYKDKDKDLNHTFLGLDTACLSCHTDEHRGQLKQDCLTCHTMNGWKPAPGFNHDKTGYKLNGLHKNVKCGLCHKTVQDKKFPDDGSFIRFANVKHNLCTDCHNDIHNNKFGKNCSQCHNTSGWKNYDRNRFDHNRTSYPLKGKHVKLACTSCHKQGQSKKIAGFNSCNTCHSDYHRGQFANRKQRGACKECHTVAGFTPSSFTIDMHQQSAYPLQESHLAVPCIACHKKTFASNHREKTIQFKFASTTCTTCHEDVHLGATDRYLKNVNLSTEVEKCAYCHKISSWADINFDHNKTGFQLNGKHQKTSCSSCHSLQSGKVKTWHFTSVVKQCSSCHKDQHQGQFKNLSGTTDCSTCHSEVDWFAEKFNHEQQSIFSLKGAHQYVLCSGCHKPEPGNGTKVVHYKPLSTKCESCHK